MWPPNVLYVPVVLVLNLLIRFCDCWSVLGRQFHPIFSNLSSSPSRHLGCVTEAASRPSTTARRQYSSSELKSIRASQPKSRLPVELWTTLGDLGIRKRYRSKRAGRAKIRGFPVGDTTGITPTVLQSSSRSKSSFPSMLSSNVRSLPSKITELQTVVKAVKAGIVCVTETRLNDLTPDSSVEIPRFLCFRNDRSGRPGGGVCAYVDSTFPCQRLIEHEDQDIESLWINIRPFKLPRCVPAILLGVIYHSTSCAADDNVALIDHIQKVSEAFLLKHPDGLIFVNGGFNPTATGISERSVKLRTGLSQITKVLTRDTGTLDWCLTNKLKLFRDPEQLPKIGRSDHYTVLIKPCESLPGHNHSKKDFWSRDLRTSSLHAFGRWITNISTGAQCLTCPDCLKNSIFSVKPCSTPLIRTIPYCK